MQNPSRFSRTLFIFLLAGLALSGAVGCGSNGVPLTVVVNGAGRVASSPQGIYCGPVCGSFFLPGTNVVLTASAFQGSSFTGWSGGGCSGTGTCAINLQQATTVTANFGGIPLSVSVTGIGSGSITSDVGNIDCTKAGGTCDTSLTSGAAVTLTATPDQGFFFNGWLGACQGIGPCTLTLNQAASVQASFVNVAFHSNRNLDPTLDAPTIPSSVNIWLANSDGSNPQSVAGIAATNVNSYLPTFSPDGNQITFLSTRNLDGGATATVSGARNVWVVNADGSDPQALAGLDVSGAGADFNNPRWSPDGSKIVFISRRNINGTPTPNTNATDNIWVVDTDGSNLQVLNGLDVSGVLNFNPVWSPDGTKIAFTSTRNIDLSPSVNPNNGYNVWVMNADGSGLLPLTQITVGGADAQWPQWSPDGSEIAFRSNRSLGNDPNGAPVSGSNIWQMGSDGSNPVALTEDDGPVFNDTPQWSPDGSLVNFRSNQDPINPSPSGPSSPAVNIWAVASDGSQAPFPLTSLTDINLRCDGPYWAPDGSVAIFDSNRNLDPAIGTPPNTSTNVWIVNPDGSGAFPVTDLTNPSVFAGSAFNLD